MKTKRRRRRQRGGYVAGFPRMNNELLEFALFKTTGYLLNFTMELVAQYLSNQSEEIDYDSLSVDEIESQIERLENYANQFRDQITQGRIGVLETSKVHWNNRTCRQVPASIDWRDYHHTFSSATTKEEYIEKFIEEYENGEYLTTIKSAELSLREVIKFLRTILRQKEKTSNSTT